MLTLRCRVITLILSLLCFFSGSAQDVVSHNTWSYGASGSYGAFMRYRTGIPLLNYTNLFGIEAFAEKQTSGKADWERRFRYPRVGYTALFYDYGFDEELGKSFAICTYLGTNIIRRDKFLLSLDLGVGPVYSTRTYDDNDLNKAISSKISFMLYGNLKMERPLTKNWSLTGALAFRHISNGALNLPNNGMNFPMASLGFKYTPHPALVDFSLKDENRGFDRKYHVNAMLAAGVKEVLYEDTKHPAFTLSLYASRNLFKIFAINAGMDFLYDDSFPEEYHKKSLPVPDKVDGRMVAPIAGTELIMGKVSLFVQAGYYIYRKHVFEERLYQRYAIRYFITKDLFANISLKAHTGKADFIEAGIGVKL